MTFTALAWGGPLDGQQIAQERPTPIMAYVDEPGHQVTYVYERIARRFLGTIDLPHDGMTQCYQHRDFIADLEFTNVECGAWIRPNDELTKAEMMAGLRVVSYLAGEWPCHQASRMR